MVAQLQVPNVALAGKMVADGVDHAAVVDCSVRGAVALVGLICTSDDHRAHCGAQLEVLEKPLAGLDSVSADGAGAVGAGEEVMIYGSMLKRRASLEADIQVLQLPTSLARYLTTCNVAKPSRSPAFQLLPLLIHSLSWSRTKNPLSKSASILAL